LAAYASTTDTIPGTHVVAGAISAIGYALLAFFALTTSNAALAAEPDGGKLFLNHCAACHGPLGEGDGPVAAAMTAGVPSLRTLASRNDGVFPEEAVMAYIDGRTPRAAHGDRGMPIWGDVFSVLERGDEEVVNARIKVLMWFIAELQYR
jgi:mono/diheme cytochrome c family protein